MYPIPSIFPKPSTVIIRYLLMKPRPCHRLTVGVLGVSGVTVQASVEQGPVEVANQGTDVASGVRLAAPLVGVLEAVHVLLELGLPQSIVALVEGVDLSGLGDLIKNRQQKGDVSSAPAAATADNDDAPDEYCSHPSSDPA